MVQWFPGHMAKTKREIIENIKLVDIVIELLDARAPISSKNPLLDELLLHKKRLALMTKSDLSDPIQNDAWQKHFDSVDIPILFIDSLSQKNIKKIVPKVKEVLADLLVRQKRKGLKERPLRAMVVGIPNVGKSTLINVFVKKRVTNVGNTPGVTKNKQWIRISNELELLDTPGILWPKFENQEIGMTLGAIGCIKDKILPLEDMGTFIIDFLKNKYPQNLCNRYPQININDETNQIILSIAKQRNFLKQNEIVDYQRTYKSILNDVRSLKFGKITWDWCQHD